MNVASDHHDTFAAMAAAMNADTVSRQQQEIARLRGALANLVGLADLLLARDDLPLEVRKTLRLHWRINEAREALAK